MSKKEKERIQVALGKAQDTAAFYQSHFQKAEQVLKAVKEGHAATPSFQPSFLQDQDYVFTIRQLCRQAIYAVWNKEKRSASLYEIRNFVKGKIRERIDAGEWDLSKWKFPGFSTIDRRINETADKKYWKEEMVPCIGLGNGRYMPNPAMFEDETKKELEKIALLESKINP